MINRKIENRISQFLDTDKRALLITGARQVGKTYSIRKIGREKYSSFVEINFLEDTVAKKVFEEYRNTEDILTRLSAICGNQLIKNETLIFFDEVQECKEIITAIKFLVDEGSYRYILSGSLLGVDLKDIRSVPVGYMDILEMYPLDFEEFAKANKVSDFILKKIEKCFIEKEPVDSLVHSQMMDLYRLYLIVGGMPAVVSQYLLTHNLKEVERIQKSILTLYKKDISKYDPDNKLYIEDIFDLIPSELNSKNKRFILKNLNENFKFSRYSHSFLWLKDAGVAYPVFCANEPTIPLLLSKSTNLFKLFLSDVGLLSAMYANNIQIKILTKELDINFGSIYENAVVQELRAHGFDLYYYNNKKQGEVDFLVEVDGEVIPIEIKSGKNYTKHVALNNILNNALYTIHKAYVFSNENVEVNGRIIYYPIYMTMFIKREELSQDMIYRIDLSALK